MKKILNNVLFWIFIICMLTVVLGQFGDSFMSSKTENIQFSRFLQLLNENNVESVNIQGRDLYRITGKSRDGFNFQTRSVIYQDLLNEMRKNNVDFEFSTGETFLGFFTSILLSSFPMIIIVGLWFLLMRNMQSGGKSAMSFNKSNAKMVTNSTIRFSDVAGIDEAKEELEEIVAFLQNPEKFRKLGGRIPKGCLLIGAPGSGKTLLAKAVAGEARVPYILTAGSEFVEMFVGVGASRIRQVFNIAKKNAPCIIFIDEIDAVGRKRGFGMGGGHDEREQTLNQLLVEMDGFESTEGVIILAATNRADILDEALLRPGRFDRQIDVSLPDILGREKILSVHLKKIITSADVDISTVAKATPGFSGAELANLVNEAALIAARRNKKVVTTEDFEYARDKVMMGLEKKSMVMREEEKRLTAYHEAGHALVSINMPSCDPIHKATIIPRGASLGLVMNVPEHDRYSITKERMLSMIKVALAGRLAEELIFGEKSVTSGAISDIKQLTRIAKRMVMHFGMSDKVGRVYHDEEQRENISNTELDVIDDEIKRIIKECEDEVRILLKAKRDDLELLANALIVHETLTGSQITQILAGKTIQKDDITTYETKAKNTSMSILDEVLDKESLQELEVEEESEVGKQEKLSNGKKDLKEKDNVIIKKKKKVVKKDK